MGQITKQTHGSHANYSLIFFVYINLYILLILLIYLGIYYFDFDVQFNSNSFFLFQIIIIITALKISRISILDQLCSLRNSWTHLIHNIPSIIYNHTDQMSRQSIVIAHLCPQQSTQEGGGETSGLSAAMFTLTWIENRSFQALDVLHTIKFHLGVAL